MLFVPMTVTFGALNKGTNQMQYMVESFLGVCFVGFYFSFILQITSLYLVLPLSTTGDKKLNVALTCPAETHTDPLVIL